MVTARIPTEINAPPIPTVSLASRTGIMKEDKMVRRKLLVRPRYEDPYRLARFQAYTRPMKDTSLE